MGMTTRETSRKKFPEIKTKRDPNETLASAYLGQITSLISGGTTKVSPRGRKFLLEPDFAKLFANKYRSPDPAQQNVALFSSQLNAITDIVTPQVKSVGRKSRNPISAFPLTFHPD